MADQMSEFVITTPQGEEFTISAPDEKQATAIFQQYQSKNYTGPADKNGVPEGMVYDKATNRMVDAKGLAEHATPTGSLPGTWLKGMPFVGEYADELAGYLTSSDDTKNNPNQSQPIQTEVARQSQQLADENYPKTALAGKIGVGLSTLPLALEMAPTLPASLAGKVAVGVPLAAATGTAEGFVSGVGEGRDGERLDTGLHRAKVSGATGAVLGAVAPVASSAIGAGARTLLDSATINKQLSRVGLSRPAGDTLNAALTADDTLGASGMARMAKAGDEAMLADAGDTAAGLLDTTIQKSGAAGRVASNAVQSRAAQSNSKLQGMMDVVLGKPVGIDKASRDIAMKTAAARDVAYKAAYAKSIDYATPAGRAVEDVFTRTPSDILNAAIKKANNKMKIEGLQNLQIMANIADDGAVTFRQMPNMMQVDYLKRALNDVAEDSKSIRGAMSGEGQDAAKLAKQLRDAATEAVPAYKAALKLGGDTIEEKNALELGNSLLDPSVTRENVRDAARGMTDAERKQAALGLRQDIDDTMANVETALSDTNIDAREAAKALKKFSSRSAREKVTELIGVQRAAPLFKQLDQAQAALTLKAQTVANSRSFARTETAKAVSERGKDGVWQAFKEGRPIEAPRRVWQTLTGANADATQQRESKIYEEISSILTGPRGQDAVRALQSLLDAYKTGAANRTTAQATGNLAAGALALPAYQETQRRLALPAKE